MAISRGQRATATFYLAYEGLAVEGGRMPVRDLAPALLALGDLLHQANQILDPDAPPIDLEFEAVRDGSVRVLLDVVQQNPDFVQTVMGAFASDPVSALNNLVSLVLGTDGVVNLIRRIRRRPVESLATDGNVTHVRLADGETFDVPAGTGLLYEAPGIRGQTRLVIAPLRGPGVDRVRFEPSGSVQPTTVQKADVEAFDPPAISETLISDNTLDQALTVRALYFGGRSWMVSDGTGIFWARIEDAAFLGRVNEAREHFANGDTLYCRTRIRQYQDDFGRIRAEHIVLEVIRHSPAARPIILPGLTDEVPEEPPPPVSE